MAINASLVRRMAENEIYRKFFESFASRERNRRTTPVEWLVDTFGATRAEVVAFFRGLEEAELGRFIVGRRESPSRFEWAAAMNEVGRAAIGEGESIEPMSKEELEVLEDAPDMQDAGLVEHSFRLRSGTDPTILMLPLDLTEREAERLAAFIRTIPLG